MLQLAPMSNSKPLDAALEVILPHLSSKVEGQPVIAAKCIGLMAGYNAKWLDAPFKIESVERVLTSDLYNPETNRKSRTFTVAGKLDVRAIEIATDKKILFDHKTSSEQIDAPDSPYWKQLVVEGQATHYMLLEWLNGEKVDAAIWDVVRKPGISPRALFKAERAILLDTGFYADVEFPADEIAKWRADKDGRETMMMYAQRLANECTNEKPQWYFQRRYVPRLDSEVREYAGDQWDIAQDIIHARNNERHPRNSGACMLYHSPCKFLGVCSGHDSIDSERWITNDWVHPELDRDLFPGYNPDNRGLNILTNSRMRMFQTCKRKHFYTYELGKEKIDAEEREALFFGTIFHEALEQFFLTIQKQQQRQLR